MPITFDDDALKAELELDHEDVVELIQEFRDFLSESIDSLEKAIQEDNYKDARSLAHSIKGSAGNLRVNKVFEIAKTMQFKVDEGLEKELSDLFPELKEQSLAFLAESESYS